MARLHSVRPAPWRSDSLITSLPPVSVGARIFLRYHPGQRRGLPGGQRDCQDVPLPDAQRLPGQVLSPEPVRGRARTPGEANTSAQPGPAMYQVGTEGGFLPAVAVHDNTTPHSPGSRQPIPAATPPIRTAPSTCCWPRRSAPTSSSTSTAFGREASFILYSDAPAPFPGGDPRNDYFTGDPGPDRLSAAPPPPRPAIGPNTRTLMKIVVGLSNNRGTGLAGHSANLNSALAE